ncbi:MAG: DUF192 domain-containing protein [Armatimonadota bacterium]|nr:DUF192 domain-containing protein [Armatimonadota bacterium]
MPTRHRPAGLRQNRPPSAGSPLALVASMLAAAMLAVTAAGPAPAAVRYERGVLHIVQGSRRVTIQVEIARTPEARAQGLMSRTALPEDAGMLFVFEQDGRWGFWMKNTLIPLSIGFIDSRWRLLEILDMDVAPDPVQGPFAIYEPAQAYRYALEVNQGFFRRKGITPGARLELVVTK